MLNTMKVEEKRDIVTGTLECLNYSSKQPI